MNIFPYRVRFSKTGRMRFLSHHDLMRLFERALRRSGLPLRFTEGYNPHPLLAFPTALGLGIESLDEIMEFELGEWVAPRKIEGLMNAQLPPEVRVAVVEAFSRKDRSAIEFVEYEATLPGADALADGVAAFMAKAEVKVERLSDKGTRIIEIRKFVQALEVAQGRVLMRIRITDGGTAKPDEVLRAIGATPGPDIRIKKTYTEVGKR
jgi:radical SAM-linked protein